MHSHTYTLKAANILMIAFRPDVDQVCINTKHTRFYLYVWQRQGDRSVMAGVVPLSTKNYSIKDMAGNRCTFILCRWQPDFTSCISSSTLCLSVKIKSTIKRQCSWIILSTCKSRCFDIYIYGCVHVHVPLQILSNMHEAPPQAAVIHGCTRAPSTGEFPALRLLHSQDRIMFSWRGFPLPDKSLHYRRLLHLRS